VNAKTGRGCGVAKLFVISAPSGCGKTTLCRKLLDGDLGLARSLSATTRPPRAGEKDGVDYRFVSEKQFDGMIERDEFVEYEENFGQMYGTPKKPIEENLRKKRPVLLNIDVKGAMKVKEAYPENAVLIFLLPPSAEALRKRLRARMTDSHQTITGRLKIARKEMSYKDRYDYRVVNDTVENAYRKLKNIIVKEISETAQRAPCA